MPVPNLLGTWGRSAAIGLTIFVTILGFVIATGHRPFAKHRPPPAPVLLERAHVRADMLAAIVAEDHYCRVRRRDGQSALVHYRFGDALREVAPLDGEQVHRSAWVSAGAVLGAERAGRRWMLQLSDGSRIAVSATFLPKARARGWLRPPDRSGVALPDATA